jgi:hypothetical protein
LHHELNLVFHVELDTESVNSREKKIAFDWIPLDQLDSIDLRPDFLREWLANPPRPSDPPRFISQPLD